MSKSWFWAGSPARWWDRSQWRLLAWAAIGATRCFQQELFIQRKTPRAMAAENARTLHAKQRRQSSIPRTPFSRSALPGDDPHRNACMPVTARSVRCCAASACGGGRFQGLLPVMANVHVHRAAANSLTSISVVPAAPVQRVVMPDFSARPHGGSPKRSLALEYDTDRT